MIEQLTLLHYVYQTFLGLPDQALGRTQTKLYLEQNSGLASALLQFTPESC